MGESDGELEVPGSGGGARWVRCASSGSRRRPVIAAGALRGLREWRCGHGCSCGRRMERGLDEGLSRDEVYLYEEALGRSLRRDAFPR